MGEEEQRNTLEEGAVDKASEEVPERSNHDCCTEIECFSLQPWPLFRFDTPPQRTYHFAHQFRNGSACENFFKGVKWSPDGSSFLTCSEDRSLRLFYLPEDAFFQTGKLEECRFSEDSYSSALIVKEAEMVYDYCWYPYMSMLDPATCVFASTTRDHPIHLWDSVSGELRGTYRAYDDMDEITAALSVSFNFSGAKIFAGYDKRIRVFDIHRPGRDFMQYSLANEDAGNLGIASSIAFSATYSGIIAIGSYNQTTAVYAEDNMELLYVLHGQLGGVTQVQFSKDGNYIYTGGRKDPYILCWDIRNTAGVLYKLYRSTESTNQRISFDIEPSGRHLATGGQDGLVHIYDLQTGEWVSGFSAASDTVSCFSFHPSMSLAASSSGHRRFIMPESFEGSINLRGDENCASIWNFSGSWENGSSEKESNLEISEFTSNI